MSTLKTHNIEPATGTDVALGAAGDSITVSGDSLKMDIFKDAGGNTIFQSNGSGTMSNVKTGLKGGGPILISSTTFTNQANVSITSGIDSTFVKYMFVCLNINLATNNTPFKFQVNASGQSGFNENITSTFFKAFHGTNDNTVGPSYNTGDDQAGTDAVYQSLTENCGNEADEIASGILYLYDPAGTTFVKHFHSRFYSTHEYGNGSTLDNYASGYINVTAAITQIDFKAASGNFDGTIKMYGIN
jgi:hypothetical protein